MSTCDHMPDRAVSFALREVGRDFEIFARIGRWGTCGACPVSGGKTYPEFCEFTRRYDHHIALKDLVWQYERALKEGNERAERERLECDRADRAASGSRP